MKINFDNDDIQFFKNLVYEAGTMALSIQEKGLEVTRKADDSVVTQADLMVQEFLIESISKRYEDINFIYEEGFSASGEPIADDTVSIIIDPIDGTSMFSMYLPVWCVSLGIFQGNEPKHGFVYSPGFNMFFYNDHENSYINEQPVKVNSDMEIDMEANIFYASEVRKILDIQFPGKVRNLGSTALHACLTIDNGRNRTLAFIGRSYLWDWAGAIPIILKAGGHIKYLNGNEFNFSEVVSNGSKIPNYLIAYTIDSFSELKEFFSVR